MFENEFRYQTVFTLQTCFVRVESNVADVGTKLQLQYNSEDFKIRYINVAIADHNLKPMLSIS
jgi:hypothetical protein